ncbi:MAG: hypothetical protein R2838_07785 [Caldilineaceae bacterium]
MADVSGPVGKVLQVHFQYDITSDSTGPQPPRWPIRSPSLTACAGDLDAQRGDG